MKYLADFRNRMQKLETSRPVTRNHNLEIKKLIFKLDWATENK